MFSFQNDLQRVGYEIQALRDLRHQNIAKLYQVCMWSVNKRCMTWRGVETVFRSCSLSITLMATYIERKWWSKKRDHGMEIIIIIFYVFSFLHLELPAFTFSSVSLCFASFTFAKPPVPIVSLRARSDRNICVWEHWRKIAHSISYICWNAHAASMVSLYEGCTPYRSSQESPEDILLSGSGHSALSLSWTWSNNREGQAIDPSNNNPSTPNSLENRNLCYKVI